MSHQATISTEKGACDGSGFLHWWSDGVDIVREGRCPGCPNCAELRAHEREADERAAEAREDKAAALRFLAGVGLFLLCAIAIPLLLVAVISQL